NIGIMKLDAIRDLLANSVGEVIQADYSVAFPKKTLREIRTNKSGNAGYKYAFHLQRRRQSNIHQHGAAVPIKFEIHVTQARSFHCITHVFTTPRLDTKDHEPATASAHDFSAQRTAFHRRVVILVDLLQ